MGSGVNAHGSPLAKKIQYFRMLFLVERIFLIKREEMFLIYFAAEKKIS
jgi:hypothetical protein